MLITEVAAIPLWVGLALHAAAGIVERSTGRIPNILSYGSALLAMVFALALGATGIKPIFRGDILSCIGIAILTLFVLAIPFVYRLIGGGTAKALAAMAAWMGCVAPFPEALILSGAGVVALAAWIGLAYLRLRFARRGPDEEEPEVFVRQLSMSLASIVGVLIAVILLEL